MTTTNVVFGHSVKRPIKYLFALALCLACIWFSRPSYAQVSIGPEPLMMLEASQHVLKGEFPRAEILYSQVIATNPGNLQAYIQRAIVRREMKDRKGMEADAIEVLNQTNMGISKDPGNADLYYHRGTAFRLLKDFPKARADIQEAITLSPNDSWRQDLMAIDLEEKMM